MAALAGYIFAFTAENIVKHYKYENSTTFYTDLIYPVWYPFELSNKWIYGLVIAQQIHISIVGTVSTLYIELLLMSMVMLCSTYFSIISKEILQLKPNRNQMNKEKLKLIKIIKYHTEMLNLTETINNTFSMAVLFNFLASSIIICFIGFQVACGAEILEILRRMWFLLYEIVRVYIISYLGEELIQSSEGVSKSAYEHFWFNGDIIYQKCILFIITRSQKPAIINANGFAVVSLKTFTKV
ncbi:putative odorant receptor 92a [Condylostylus longicornis]|uniref:putative odorant receptor 92a n=1 Tax=Condylostylus longicornis TaxID=2530218 RepID=UPI00244E378E|nr:putative odorant receptor 92a [Condylostylus longicornis]